MTDDRPAGVDGTAASAAMSELLEIGRVVKAHGLHGEVVVSLVSNVPDRLAAGVEVALGPEGRRLGVAESRPFQHRYLVKFEGIDTREAAEALHGVVVYAEPMADPAALYVHDLIGSEVFDSDGRCYGRVVAVESNPASDLLVGDAGWLVPLRFVVDHGGGRIVVDGPPGLFD